MLALKDGKSSLKTVSNDLQSALISSMPLDSYMPNYQVREEQYHGYQMKGAPPSGVEAFQEHQYR